MTTPIIDRLEGFRQVCVWPGTLLCPEGETPTAEHIADFVAFFADEMSVRVQYLESVTTLPDLGEFGNQLPDTGGRVDILFAVHQGDVGRFAVPRLRLGVRWIEDVLDSGNHNRHMYDCERLDQYKTW